MFGSMKGWTLTEALEHLSDPDDLDARNKLRDCLSLETDPGERIQLRDKLQALTSRLEANVVRLLRGFLFPASGFVLPLTAGSHRELISADLWELAEVEFYNSSMHVHNLRIVHIEVYGSMMGKGHGQQIKKADEVPSDPVQQVVPTEFQWSEDYTKVKMREHVFLFRGPMQVAVVKQLHEASLTSFPWVHGKLLLKKANSGSSTIADLFKSQVDPSWRELIDSDRTGRYRLRLLNVIGGALEIPK